MTTTHDLAVRNGHAPAQPSAALAIRTGQTEWDEAQRAAFGQLGIADASDGDRAVFMHVSQRTGLDPFARQIYMIPRPEKMPNGQWGKKWTIQTGIEGWRVIRDRAEHREGVRGKLSRAIWYDDSGDEHKVWVRAEAPAACEITYTVRDSNGVETPYTSVLQFREYAQTRKDGDKTVLSAQWAVKKSHMLEKCTEADVYRKAFPQDFSGVYLDDTMPAVEDMTEEELAAAFAKVTQRQRVTPDQIRQRHTVTAQVVTPDASPAQAATPVAAEPDDSPPPGAGEAPSRGPSPDSDAYRQLRDDVQDHFTRLKIGEDQHEKRMQLAARIVGLGPGVALASLNECTGAELADIKDRLSRSRDEAALRKLLDTGEAPDGA